MKHEKEMSKMPKGMPPKKMMMGNSKMVMSSQMQKMMKGHNKPMK